MRVLRGNAASSGIAIGAASVWGPRLRVEERRISEEGIGAELERFDAALARTDAAMGAIALAPTTPHAALGSDLVDTHRALLKSDEIALGARALIRERRLGAEWAVRSVVEELRPIFAAMNDARFSSRFDDVEAVGNRLLRTLLSAPEVNLDAVAGAVVVAFEVSPLDALQLHRAGAIALLTERGGFTSHAAIVARALGLPFVFGIPHLLQAVRPKERVSVDGTSGEVVLDPDALTQQAFVKRHLVECERRRRAQEAGGTTAATSDGIRLELGANVESAAEMAAAMAAGADHVGLVRTELLYLDRRELPSEEEQLHDAVTILTGAAGRTVTFRTLDIGGDKLPPAVRTVAGPNPALGVRGIRFSLRRLDVFRVQLRALMRAAVRAPMRIMFPMISSVDEMRQARAICAEVAEELSRSGLEHEASVPIGAMIETPSAAMTADHIAAECDFLSIGSNDLVHYAFAADRQSDEVAYLYRPLHPAILRMLQRVLDVDVPVSICGDMALDPRCVIILLGLGLRTFSMTSSALPFIRALLRRTALAEAQELAHEALQMSDASAIEALVTRRMGSRFADEFPINLPAAAAGV